MTGVGITYLIEVISSSFCHSESHPCGPRFHSIKNILENGALNFNPVFEEVPQPQSEHSNHSTHLPSHEFDLKSEHEAFDNTKTGVIGLVDSGISNVPRIFKTTTTTTTNSNNNVANDLAIPIIDLERIHSAPGSRKKVIEEIKYACEEWGFFQIVKHGIPLGLLDVMINGVRGFHEQDADLKKPYYSRDKTRKFKYYSSYALYSGTVANWKDSFGCIIAPDHLDPLLLPEICRGIILEYTKQVKEVGIALLELMSEALGLGPDFLKEMECGEGMYIQAHYYPACPEPELAIGTSSHADPGFFTVLLQDDIGGLQILHDENWVNVDPIPGALVINIGDLLQLVTNDRFKSAIHRVPAQGVGPRISVACFSMTYFQESEQSRLYGPIKELVSEHIPPIYKEITITEFLTHIYSKGLDGSSALSRFTI